MYCVVFGSSLWLLVIDLVCYLVSLFVVGKFCLAVVVGHLDVVERCVLEVVCLDHFVGSAGVQVVLVMLNSCSMLVASVVASSDSTVVLSILQTPLRVLVVGKE